jgi:hypothetical protein
MLFNTNTADACSIFPYDCLKSAKDFNKPKNLYFTTLSTFIVVLGGSTLWHLQRFLQCIKYITLEFTPSITLLYHLLPGFLEQFQQVSFLH